LQIEQAPSDEASNTAGGEGAAAETKKKNFIAFFVVTSEPMISALNMPRYTDTDRAPPPTPSSRLCPLATDAGMVVPELLDISVVFGDGVVDLEDVGRRRKTVVFLVGVVPSAVTADNETFHMMEFHQVGGFYAEPFGESLHHVNACRVAAAF